MEARCLPTVPKISSDFARIKQKKPTPAIYWCFPPPALDPQHRAPPGPDRATRSVQLAHTLHQPAARQDTEVTPCQFCPSCCGTDTQTHFRKPSKRAYICHCHFGQQWHLPERQALASFHRFLSSFPSLPGWICRPLSLWQLFGLLPFSSPTLRSATLLIVAPVSRLESTCSSIGTLDSVTYITTKLTSLFLESC